MSSCCTVSLFTNVTLPPCRTVMLFGTEPRFTMRTVADSAAGGALGAELWVVEGSGSGSLPEAVKRGAESLTTSTPFIHGCGLQWYGNFPEELNVWLHFAPELNGPEPRSTV